VTTQTYRPARHSASALHAHLVFVTTYRRPVCTDEILTVAENTVRATCSELDTQLVEFTGETHHLPARGLPTHLGDHDTTGRCVRARMRGHL
jgi:Transposase IS200 like